MNLHRILLVAVSVAVAAVLGVGGLAFATGNVGSPQLPPPNVGFPQPPEKQAIEDRERAREEAARRGPQGPKPANPHLLPVTRHYQTGIWPFTFGPFSNRWVSMVNVAAALSGQRPFYTIYAGSLSDEPRQVVLLVFRDADPPYFRAGSTAHLYLRPLQWGGLTTTSIH